MTNNFLCYIIEVCLSAMIKQTLQESDYTPKEDFEISLDNPKYHHSKKGCDVFMYYKQGERGFPVLKYCLTHNVVCSKTGWETGWYNGECSKDIWVDDFYINKCKICGNDFKARNHNMCYCSKICRHKGALINHNKWKKRTYTNRK